MSLLRKWSELSREERRLTINAWGWLAFASVRLRIVPAGENLEGLRRHETARRFAGDTVDPRLVDAAVRRASRFVPGTRCLAAALAAQAMLAGSGTPSIHYAVTRDDAGGDLIAHAWVEMDGRRVAGDPPEEDAATLSPRTTP